MRQKQHGGIIIVIPSRITKDDTRLTERINIKYPCSYDYAWELMVQNLVKHHKYYELYFPLWDGKRKISTAIFKNHQILAMETQELEEALIDASWTIATLMSVDGAVLMTDRFHVIGFGAEVTAPSHSLREIVVAAKPKHSRVPMETYGTRHRAAFRFCSSLEDSIAFVVSRDGGVKAVKRVEKDVFLWPDINTGYMGL